MGIIDDCLKIRLDKPKIYPDKHVWSLVVRSCGK